MQVWAQRTGEITRGLDFLPRAEDHTMRYPLIAGLACAALLASVTAVAAQTPAVPGSVPGEAAATPETAAAKPKPKRKGPPSSVTVINATANTARVLSSRLARNPPSSRSRWPPRDARRSDCRS